MEDERIEHPLLIDNCFKIFDQSFNRLKYFSCLASHLELSNMPTDWSIKNSSGINYAVKAPETEQEKEMLIEGYKHFLHCYVVRDCIETFAIALDRLFFTLLLNGKKVLAGQPLFAALTDTEKELLNNFQYVGLSAEKKRGKVELLKSEFDLELTAENKEIISGFRDIRNCFSHGYGLVRAGDGQDAGDGKRKFSWKTMSIFLRGEESGKEFGLVMNEPLPEASMLCMRIENHVKNFKVGEQLSFTASEAFEIATSLQHVARNFLSEINQKIIGNKQAIG